MDINISLKQAILHILDTNAGIPVLSDKTLALEISIRDWLEKHVMRAMKDTDVKRTRFSDPESSFCSLTKAFALEPPEAFIAYSQAIATLFYEMMIENVDIPSADLLVVTFSAEERDYLGIYKMNYKHSYIHYVDYEEVKSNDILLQPCALPTESQKLDEFIIVDLSTMELLLKERKYEIDGQKEFYLSNRLVCCQEALSEKQTFDVVEKTVKKIIASEYGGDVEKLNAARQVIVDDFTTDCTIDLENIAEATFGLDTTVKEKFREEVEKKGVTAQKVTVTPNLEKRILRKQKFITDSGIEIAIPTDYLDREDIIAFVNNPDGTVSVEIKNIELIKQK